MAYQLHWSTTDQNAVILSMKRGGTTSSGRPRASLICEIRIATAIPAVKPTMTGRDMNLSQEPMPLNPIKMSMIPASKVACKRPTRPNV